MPEIVPIYADAFVFTLGKDDIAITFLLQRPLYQVNPNPGPQSPTILTPLGQTVERVAEIYLTQENAKDLAEKILTEIRKRGL